MTHWTYSRKRAGSAIPVLFVSCVLASGCDPMIEFIRGEDWAAKNAVERYLDADKSGEPIGDFWCRPEMAKRHFLGPMSFEVEPYRKENTTGEDGGATWFAFKVTTRTTDERAYAGFLTERYIAYVKKMPDDAYKLFGFVKESEAQEWESMKLRMAANEKACALPR